MTSIPFHAIRDYFLTLQENLCDRLTGEDKQGFFQVDHWNRNQDFGGITKIFKQGSVFEHAGINFSHVKGECLPPSATLKRPELKDCQFEAMGVSSVIHPLNPYVPTTHFNLRFLQAIKPNQSPYWWFGGGFDLTPYYPFMEDCIHWHTVAAKACAPFGAELYSIYKQNCDQYFFLKHRNETRGIGGLFFDDLNEWPFEKCFNFIQSIGAHFLEAYLPIVQKRKKHTFGERERHFQCYRRGRYVEFNLLYDRGTLFGLQSGGRTESILMSLPPVVHWHYCFEAEPNSPEENLKNYLKARDWLHTDS